VKQNWFDILVDEQNYWHSFLNLKLKQSQWNVRSTVLCRYL